MRLRTILLALGAASVAGCSTTQTGPTITTGTLVREMVDLRRFCDYPQPTFKTVQFSSYDRRSNLPDGPDWFANSDGFGHEPIPNFEAVIKEAAKDREGEYLICDVKGPGAIVRVWTARIVGKIRLYLDGSDVPVFDGDAADFLQKTWYGWAKQAGIDENLFEKTFRQREAGYYPIPFARRCRIVFLGSHHQVHFYQVQIRQYEPTANVVTFAPADLKTYKAEIEQTAKVLADPDGQWPYASTEKEVAIDATLAPGKKIDLARLDGPGAIERLTLTATGQRINDALRQTVLKVICDEYPRPQVESPLGDFFGAAPGINPYTSVPFTVKDDGTMTSRLVMPFKKNVRVMAENNGSQEVRIVGSLLPMKYTWNDQRSMHFRARWRADHDLVASCDAVEDMPYLIARGQGVFLGVAAFLLNPNTIPKSGGNWWGEGDENIFSDGDIRPSTFGTGSEDYFNYAWSACDIFAFPYCGQPRDDGPANAGFVTNFRWQILDCMPFNHSFAFYMELFPHTTVPGFSYCRTAYHYARPGLIDDMRRITPADLRHLEMPEFWQPQAAGRATGGIFHQIESLAEIKPNISLRDSTRYSGNKLMVWQPAKKGDELTLTVPITEDGRYDLNLIACLDGSSGTVSAKVDSQACPIGTMDLFVPSRTLLRVRELGGFLLKKGDHTITLRYEGPSPEGANVSRPVIGLDYLWVQKVKK